MRELWRKERWENGGENCGDGSERKCWRKFKSCLLSTVEPLKNAGSVCMCVVSVYMWINMCVF